MTDVLDLTSDLHTALFFAMCDYDSANDCHTAKKDDKEHIGYLYAYPAIASAMQHNGSAFGRFQIGGNLISHLEGHRVLNKKCCRIFSERVGVLIVI